MTMNHLAAKTLLEGTFCNLVGKRLNTALYPAGKALQSTSRFFFATSKGKESTIPDVMVTFGVRMNQMTFVSHPGVMAISKLLEMRYLTRPRATLTQENVDAIKEFDEELAAKAQLALDNNLSLNFMDIEHIEKPGMLEMFVKEKVVLEKIRKDVLEAPVGDYRPPKSLASYTRPEVPASFRPEIQLEEEMTKSLPGGNETLEFHDTVKSHVELLAGVGKGENKGIPAGNIEPIRKQKQ